MKRIDSHQHFWHYDSNQYPWIQADWPIRKSFVPEDLLPHLQAAKIDGCIAVQARQSLAESEWLLGLASIYPFVAGVVGWVDLCSRDVSKQLATLTRNSKFKGVRHVVQDEPDDRFMLREDFQKGIAELASYQLPYDILIYPKQLPAAIELVEKFPDQPFVLDHIAKPSMRRSLPASNFSMKLWSEQIARLSRSKNVFCKVSGLVTEASWTDWKAQDFRPCLEVVLDAFGPRRLMYGSDWPVALLAASYAQVYSVAEEFFSTLSQSEKDSIFGGNAVEFYRLDP